MARLSTALLFTLLVACAHVPVMEDAVIADRLFFGRAIPGGGTVTDDDWNTFVREVVTPRFPNGFTVWRAEGQWRGPDGEVVREPSMIIEILRPQDAALDRAVLEIADEYRRRFRQDAVLRVSTPARMDFVD